jgi:hypothetical protein
MTDDTMALNDPIATWFASFDRPVGIAVAMVMLSLVLLICINLFARR